MNAGYFMLMPRTVNLMLENATVMKKVSDPSPYNHNSVDSKIMPTQQTYARPHSRNIELEADLHSEKSQNTDLGGQLAKCTRILAGKTDEFSSEHKRANALNKALNKALAANSSEHKRVNALKEVTRALHEMTDARNTALAEVSRARTYRLYSGKLHIILKFCIFE